MHRWMEYERGKAWGEIGYLHKVPPVYLLMIEGKIVTLQWVNLADTTFTKWPRLTSPVIRHFDIMYLLIWNAIASVVSFSVMHSLNLIIRNYHTNPKWWTSYNDQNSSNVSESWKIRKDWGTVTGWRRLMRHDKKMQKDPGLGSAREKWHQ